MTTNGKTREAPVPGDRDTIELRLRVTDREPDLYNDLHGYPEGPERADFAVSLMSLGGNAYRMARGRIDIELVREEGDRLIQNLTDVFERREEAILRGISSRLGMYFDKDTGLVQARINSLVKEGGDLDQVIRPLIGDNGSVLVKTLDSHVGVNSPLMRTVDPDSASGLLAKLTKILGDILSERDERIIGQFSLDNPEGALSRTVAELKEKHGDVGEALDKRIGDMLAEFSLDREDSSLSRLVSRVEVAHRQTSKELSLDEDNSALARLRREFIEFFQRLEKQNNAFQVEVSRTLAEMTARRRESERSTQHGIDFEAAAYETIAARSQRKGHIAEHVGSKSGRIPRNKKGDIVVTLGPEHSAAGAQIVVEAKESASFTLQNALDESAKARENREAEIGIFIFSARSAPEELEPFNRYGDDIVLVWDSEDANSDVILDVGLSVAEAFSVRARSHTDEVSQDFDIVEDAIRDIQQQIKNLDSITTWSETMKNNSVKISNSAHKVRESLTSQVAILDEKVAGFRKVVSD